MAKIWWKKIKKGDVLFVECPSSLKAQVITLAKADVVNGVITAEQYEEFIGEPYTE